MSHAVLPRAGLLFILAAPGTRAAAQLPAREPVDSTARRILTHAIARRHALLAALRRCLGNLTPFLSPFDLAVSFTWQLSSYPTERFHFGVGVTGP